jgi:hypothetical protein
MNEMLRTTSEVLELFELCSGVVFQIGQELKKP